MSNRSLTIALSFIVLTSCCGSRTCRSERCGPTAVGTLFRDPAAVGIFRRYDDYSTDEIELILDGSMRRELYEPSGRVAALGSWWSADATHVFILSRMIVATGKFSSRGPTGYLEFAVVSPGELTIESGHPVVGEVELETAPWSDVVLTGRRFDRSESSGQRP